MAETNYKDATLVRPLVLAVDLDETFAAGDGSNRETLFSVLEAHADEVRLIYMSHGTAEQLIGIAADAVVLATGKTIMPLICPAGALPGSGAAGKGVSPACLTPLTDGRVSTTAATDTPASARSKAVA